MFETPAIILILTYFRTLFPSIILYLCTVIPPSNGVFEEKSPNTKPSYLFDPLKNWIYIEPVFLVLRVGVTS